MIVKSHGGHVTFES